MQSEDEKRRDNAILVACQIADALCFLESCSSSENPFPMNTYLMQVLDAYSVRIVEGESGLHSFLSLDYLAPSTRGRNIDSWRE